MEGLWIFRNRKSGIMSTNLLLFHFTQLRISRSTKTDTRLYVSHNIQRIYKGIKPCKMGPITLAVTMVSLVISWGLSWPPMVGRKLHNNVTSVRVKATFSGFTRYISMVMGSAIV